MAVPKPSTNRKRYDSEINKPTLLQYGKNANKKPDTPWVTAPKLKHNFVPIFDPYFPKIGLNIKSDRFAIPNTNPYSAGLPPFNSASDG